MVVYGHISPCKQEEPSSIYQRIHFLVERWQYQHRADDVDCLTVCHERRQDIDLQAGPGEMVGFDAIAACCAKPVFCSQIITGDVLQNFEKITL